MSVLYPYGVTDTLAMTATGAQALTISNNLTIVDGVTALGTGNRTLNLTIATSLKPGAKLVVKSATDGTETFTPGTGMTGPTITGVANKTFVVQYVYDGTAFLALSSAVQIN